MNETFEDLSRRNDHYEDESSKEIESFLRLYLPLFSGLFLLSYVMLPLLLETKNNSVPDPVLIFIAEVIYCFTIITFVAISILFYQIRMLKSRRRNVIQKVKDYDFIESGWFYKNLVKKRPFSVLMGTESSSITAFLFSTLFGLIIFLAFGLPYYYFSINKFPNLIYIFLLFVLGLITSLFYFSDIIIVIIFYMFFRSIIGFEKKYYLKASTLSAFVELFVLLSKYQSEDICNKNIPFWDYDFNNKKEYAGIDLYHFYIENEKKMNNGFLQRFLMKIFKIKRVEKKNPKGIYEYSFKKNQIEDILKRLKKFGDIKLELSFNNILNRNSNNYWDDLIEVVKKKVI